MRGIPAAALSAEGPGQIEIGPAKLESEGMSLNAIALTEPDESIRLLAKKSFLFCRNSSPLSDINWPVWHEQARMNSSDIRRRKISAAIVLLLSAKCELIQGVGRELLFAALPSERPLVNTYLGLTLA